MLSDFDVSRPWLIRDGSFLERDWQEIARRRVPNRLGFAYQVAFVRVLGRFPHQEPLEIDGEVLRFAALQLGTDPDAIEDYAERRQTVTEHQRRIRDYLGLRSFDGRAADDLTGFLRSEAQAPRQDGLVADARASTAPRPPGSGGRRFRVARVLGSARQAARTAMVERMEATLSVTQRERLDGLVDTGDDRFCPRIRSVHRQRIYCSDPTRDHGVLEPVLQRGRRSVNFRLIAEQWERIGQFYAAFPAGTCHCVRGTPAASTASTLRTGSTPPTANSAGH